MQGRLSPLVGGKIQAFPAAHWREEFALAARCGFSLIEWTLDHDGLRENPLMTPAGRSEIRRLGERHGIEVQSLTGDCFMQAPFFKTSGSAAGALHDELACVLEAAAALGIRLVVLPLVDKGRLETQEEAHRLHRGLESVMPVLRDGAMKIVFESDFEPEDLRRFIAGYPLREFGINYDMGNSASLGFDPREEIEAFGARIDNVHVKDRLRGSGTVPLGRGAADLPLVFNLLKGAGYRGNYILQTARAADGAHHTVLCHNRDLVKAWLGEDS